MLFATLLTAACAAALPLNFQGSDAAVAFPRAILGEVTIDRAVDSNVMQSSHHGKRQDTPPSPDEVLQTYPSFKFGLPPFQQQALLDLLRAMSQVRYDSAAATAEARMRFCSRAFPAGDTLDKRQDPIKPPEAALIDLHLPELVPASPGVQPVIPDRPGSGPPTPQVDVSVPVDKIIEDTRNRMKEALERLHSGNSINDAYKYMQEIADAMAKLSALAVLQASAHMKVSSPAPEEV
ncbi:hypothetical protein A1Q2_05350 [Trichosporon asahii var. asahii CBS 8904]|uniref:Uncharacterized protein n=1 Tax=Trichosporon asahii var. asahii (strain CBS 8904) TaxID=1220162 RepID=K1VHQ0_TRIAC|nr:hypothetical protein A1Q2_05350 [Trichosporon asahii var. asahii CBS 8904]